MDASGLPPLSPGRGRGTSMKYENEQQPKNRYDEEVSEELWEPLKLFIGCLKHEVTEGELQDVLVQYAKVKKVTIIKDKFSRSGEVYGFVTVDSKEDVDKLLGLKDGDLYIRGKPMVVKRAQKQILQPGQRGYKRIKLSDRPYDLMPPDPNLPSAHILVDEVLVKIISYLPLEPRVRIERVCRRWQSLVRLSFATLTSLEIQKGTMGLSRPIEWPILSKLLVLTGPSLRVLKVSYVDARERHNLLRTIGQLCPNLMEIEMNVVDSITSSNIEEFSHYCPGLRKFVFKNACGLMNDFLPTLLTHFRSLEYLGIGILVTLVGDSLKHLPSTIKELHLNTSIQEENLEYIPQLCPNLEVLDVYFDDCTSSIFEKLNQNCPKLTTLYVEDFTETMALGITALKGLKSLIVRSGNLDKMKACPQLESLHIENVALQPTTDLRILKNLKKLTISPCDGPIPRETFMSITQCTQLEEVIIEMALHNIIPGDFLLELVKNCPLLKKVDINILKVGLKDMKTLSKLVKNRTSKLVIKVNRLRNEVLESEYDAEKLELLCRYHISEDSDSDGSYDCYNSLDYINGQYFDRVFDDFYGEDEDFFDD